MFLLLNGVPCVCIRCAFALCLFFGLGACFPFLRFAWQGMGTPRRRGSGSTVLHITRASLSLIRGTRISEPYVDAKIRQPRHGARSLSRGALRGIGGMDVTEKTLELIMMAWKWATISATPGALTCRRAQTYQMRTSRGQGQLMSRVLPRAVRGHATMGTRSLTGRV